MTNKLRILVVEDEPAIRDGLIDVLVYHGYDVDAVGDGQEGLNRALNGHYDLVLLDVMLPSLDGFQICDQIRERNREQAIVMLTAKVAEEDIITGLKLGADDYVAKPFSITELMLRIEAVLRRSRSAQSVDRYLEIGGKIEIDTENLDGALHGKPLQFTRREIEILRYLFANSDRAVSRDELLSEVWGYARHADIETRTVDIHIAKLRRKIEDDPKNPDTLTTVRGAGYRLIV